MLILELEKVEIDHCPACAGIWLDRGELDLLLGNSAISHKMLTNVSNLQPVHEKKIPCPRCGAKMEKRRAGDKNQSVLDQCPQHHGIWFDRGELAAVLDQAQTEESQKVAALLRNMFQHQLSSPST